MDFSKTWIASKQPRKQRKYRFNAPLHVKQKLTKAHLSKELRKKYGFRSIQLKRGDSVRIVRGQFRKKTGKVERVNLKKGRVHISGLEFTKKEGTKAFYAVNPSNIVVTELADIDDKKRKKILERVVK
jgi:large subunit ribosomal protein L24